MVALVSGLSPEQVIELKHGLAGVAEVTWTFFVELKGQGFNDEQALRLTIAWLRAQFAGGGAE